MSNKSHFNSGHIAINQLRKNGVWHSSTITGISTPRTIHGVFIQDAVDFLKALPNSSVQLILIDPPYNLDLEIWDSFQNYLNWAKGWLDQIYRVLSDSGNCVIFGGFQYQDLKKGDLLEILHYTRHETPLRFAIPVPNLGEVRIKANRVNTPQIRDVVPDHSYSNRQGGEDL